MKYKIKAVRMNSDFEEEIIIRVEDVELLCFVSDWGPDIDMDKFYLASIDVLVLDEIEIDENADEKIGFEQIGDSFAYNIYEKFDFDARAINAGITIVFNEDDVDLFDYAYLDGKYVCVKVDRITLAFGS
jgi:hypothetical protein